MAFTKAERMLVQSSVNYELALVKQREENFAKFQREMTRMNFFTTPEHLLKEAFDALEYTGFYDQSSKSDQMFTVHEALELLTDPSISHSEANPEFAFTQIYGAGGWNRYYVYPDGSIRFSDSHSTSAETRRAAGIGFEIV